MKSLRLVTAVLFLAAACASSLHDADVSVSVAPDSRTVKIGERVNITISARGERANLDTSALASGLGNVLRIEETRGNGTSVWRLAFTAFEPGIVEIPPMPVRLSRSANGDERTTTTSIALTFTAPDVGAGDELRPLSGRLPSSRRPSAIALVFTAATVAGSLLALRPSLRRFVDRHRRNRDWKRLVGKLVAHEVRAPRASATEARAVGHIAAADFRMALGEVFDRTIAARSTPDIVEIVRQGGTDAETVVIVERLLSSLDVARFGPDVVARDVAVAVAAAANFVRNCRPAGTGARSW